MAKRTKHQGPSLEREVIIAVTALYLLISIAMLAIHHLQPAGQRTKTSSTSRSHETFSRSQQTQPPPESAPAPRNTQ